MAGQGDAQILVIDDNAANLKLMRYLLSRRGYAVRTASTAEKAVAEIRANPPDVILMDVQLPGMDGLELTRRLKADRASRHIVIIALTAYAMKGDEARALAAGCDAYVPKPVDTRRLPQVIAEQLARARAQVMPDKG